MASKILVLAITIFQVLCWLSGANQKELFDSLALWIIITITNLSLIVPYFGRGLLNPWELLVKDKDQIV